MNKKTDIRIILKYLTFMKIAESIGDLSYDEKHQVGAILAKKDFTNITAIGFNGNYAGGLNERESMEHGMSGYLHAEENLIGNTDQSKEIISEYYRAFVTMTPCNMCTKRLLGKGIKEIIYLKEYTNCGNTHEIIKSVNASCKTLKEVIIDLYDKSHLSVELENSNDLTDLFNKQIKSIFEIENSKKYLNNYQEIVIKDKKHFKEMFFVTLYSLIKNG